MNYLKKNLKTKMLNNMFIILELKKFKITIKNNQIVKTYSNIFNLSKIIKIKVKI